MGHIKTNSRLDPTHGPCLPALLPTQQLIGKALLCLSSDRHGEKHRRVGFGGLGDPGGCLTLAPQIVQ